MNMVRSLFICMIKFIYKVLTQRNIFTTYIVWLKTSIINTSIVCIDGMKGIDGHWAVFKLNTGVVLLTQPTIGYIWN